MPTGSNWQVNRNHVLCDEETRGSVRLGWQANP
jgi:hypothetical protein